MKNGVSIIVVSYNVASSLQRCLDSYLIQIDPVIDEIIVIDNNSTDHSIDMMEENFPNIRLIKNVQNSGYSKACNQGYRNSKNNILIFSNGDITVPNNFLNLVKEKMNSLSNCGIIGSQLISFEGSIIQPSWSYNFTFLNQIFLSLFSPDRVSGSSIIKNLVIMRQRKDKPVPVVDGACMILSRKMLDVIGGMDENFELYFEDVDICLRCRQAGFNIYFVPSIKAFHGLGKSGEVMPRKIQLIYRQSQIYYYRKHNSWIELLLIKFYLLLKCFLQGVWRDKVYFQYFKNILFERKHYKLSDSILVDSKDNFYQ